MRITVECDYALRIVLYLAQIGMENKADAVTIATAQKIPQRFSAKILRKLTMAGVIKSFKGAAGGYSLQKSPSELTLLDIVEIIDGEIAVNRCIATDYSRSCACGEDCAIHNEFAEINEIIKEKLNAVSFDSLIRE